MSTSTSQSTLYLADLLPRAGFFWQQDRGSPTIMKRRRDAKVIEALQGALSGHKLTKANVCAVFASAFDTLSASVEDGGLGQNQCIIEWLEEGAAGIDIASRMHPMLW